MGAWRLLARVTGRFRRDPVEAELRRRRNINAIGRLGDAVVSDVCGDSIYYSYSIRGVAYTATQDVSQLRALIPERLELLVGPATLKYAPQNPVDSILICEEWSGLRKAGSNLQLFYTS